MRRWRGVVVAAAIAAGLGRAPEAVSEADAPPGGYNIERSQSVQDAPVGHVGRKTTDRERRVGKEKETAGRVARETVDEVRVLAERMTYYVLPTARADSRAPSG